MVHLCFTFIQPKTLKAIKITHRNKIPHHPKLRGYDPSATATQCTMKESQLFLKDGHLEDHRLQKSFMFYLKYKYIQQQ